MNATTQPQPVAEARPTLAEARVKEATLRRVSKLSLAVVLVTAGILIGIHLNAELGATLLVAGLHEGVEGMIAGHDERKHPRVSINNYVPALA